jgi:hypothetical protein
MTFINYIKERMIVIIINPNKNNIPLPILSVDVLNLLLNIILFIILFFLK